MDQSGAGVGWIIFLLIFPAYFSGWLSELWCAVCTVTEFMSYPVFATVSATLFVVKPDTGRHCEEEARHEL